MSGDPYGLIASGLPPEMAAEAQGISRKQAIMQAMLDQALQGTPPAQNKGRLESKPSWIAPVLQAVKGYMGAQGLQEGDKAMGDLAGRQRQSVADAMTRYEQMKSGSPAQPPLTPNDDEGNPMPGLPAQAGNARMAITQAMLDPRIAKNPVVAADLKKMEPNYKVEEQFNPVSGRKEKMLVNMNDPSDVKPFGGSEAPKLEKVTRANSQTGAPEEVFVNPQTQTTPIAAPVKAEYKDTGPQIIPVPAYTAPGAPAAPIAKQVSSDTAAHIAASYNIHGLGADGLPTGDIKEVAKAIAEGRLPPLSSMAMASPRGQMIQSEITKINPNYDIKDFHAADQAVKAFASGKQGNTVRSFNVAINHLGTLDQLADALHNGDLPAVNKIGNLVSTQTGGAPPTNFDAAKKIVSDEIVKAIVGSGGGVEDRKQASENVSKANSPAQLKGVIATYKELMKGQLGGLKQQYETSTGRKDFDKFLSDEAATVAHGRRASDAPGSVLKFDAQGNLIQ